VQPRFIRYWQRLQYGIRPPAFRLPDETALGPVRLQVRDLERSLQYYERILGLRVVTRLGDSAALAPGSDATPLIWLHAHAGARPAPRGGLLGLYHFAILLPDRVSLGKFVAHLSATGTYAGSADHFVSEALYLTDPDGLGIEVYADRPRSMWRQNGLQLYMTTEPLDIRGLLATAGSQSWTGMPPGTIMGHVHLHVGDLDRAARFYHAGLGFDKIVWDYPGALFMSAGGYHHHLGTNTWSSGPPASADDARLLAWDVILPDAAAVGDARRSIEAGGHEVEEIPGGWSAADPWGTTVRVVSSG
jgi:catechol 2,3-dioxygenase